VATVVSREHDSKAKQTTNLSRLSAAERQVLWLLSEGHTVKSIAIAIGSTQATVNERLREARRKTGVGSSRELARSLKAQENRYKLIGMGNARGFGAALSEPDAEPWRPRTGVFAMIGLLTLTVAGAATLLTQVGPTNEEPRSNPQVITDPDLGTFRGEGPSWLYPMIRKEARDPNWAPVAERTLRERYATVLFYGTKPQMRIMCRTRTCEVAVPIPAATTESSYGQVEPSIVKDMRSKGLIQAGAIITADTKSRRALYLAYYLRAQR
jgi:DNA-binding CsgD family transcriptional regulator